MERRKGFNNDTLKRRNRGLLLNLILTERDMTRSELARRTGLSKMSVTNIINEFTEQGIVEERCSLAVKGQGRNPIALCLAETAPKLVGLHIFRDCCTAVLCDLRLHVLREAQFEMNAEIAADLGSALCALVEQVLPQDRSDVLGIGISAIGPVDLKNGVIMNSPDFFGIHDFPAAELLRNAFGLPVAMDSQCNCSALAEKYFGAGRDYADFIFLGLANGIGSGIISQNSLLRNVSGLTSEVGHISIDRQGRPCPCGRRGCLETYAGTRVVERALRQANGRMPNGGRGPTFRDFCAMPPEEVPVGPFEEMIDILGFALADTVNVLNPQAIIIGYEGACLPDRCLKQLAETVNAQRLVQFGPRIRVLRSAFGDRAQVIGSAGGLLSEVFEGKFI